MNAIKQQYGNMRHSNPLVSSHPPEGVVLLLVVVVIKFKSVRFPPKIL
jgi:hypothetical protein